MTFRDYFYAMWLWGQSNTTGEVFSPPDTVPTGLPIAGCGFQPVVAPAGSSQAVAATTLTALNVTTPTIPPPTNPLYWSTEISLGHDIVALGAPCAILKTSRNGSSVVSWLQSTGTNFVVLQTYLPIWKANVITAAAGRPIKWFPFTNQGENEAEDPSPTPASNWSANVTQLLADAKGVLDAAPGGVITWEPKIVLITNSHFTTGGAPNLATVRAQQLIADPNAINADDVAGYVSPHYVTPSAVAIVGSRQALRVIPRNFLASQQLTVR